MKAFWWFEENAIAGMARPGFNRIRWFDFPYEEALLVGWIGQFSSGSTSLKDLHTHVQNYGSKILKFYNADEKVLNETLQLYSDRAGLLDIFNRISDSSHLFESYDVTENRIHFEFNKKRLNWELDYLKEQGIKKIVSLTENHHSKETLQEHFDTFHFSINDLDAPKAEQVHQLADVIRTAKKNNEKIAVHCLAGIGRTSTMLITAHLAMGEKLEKMKTLIARQNPAFVFAGRQAEFIHSFSEKLGS